jgi:hypothetical protein
MAKIKQFPPPPSLQKFLNGSERLDNDFEGLIDICKGDFADMSANFFLMFIGSQVECVWALSALSPLGLFKLLMRQTTLI